MLVLKFHYKDTNSRVYLVTEAAMNAFGNYKDAKYIYTKIGKFERSKVFDLVEEWTT